MHKGSNLSVLGVQELLDLSALVAVLALCVFVAVEVTVDAWPALPLPWPMGDMASLFHVT